MKLNVKVIPNAKINQIQQEIDGSLRIHMTAKPQDGEANERLIKMLSKHYNVNRSGIKIVSGLKSKNKIVYLFEK